MRGNEAGRHATPRMAGQCGALRTCFMGTGFSQEALRPQIDTERDAIFDRIPL
jgi:hypothetical protein